jgi:hypothetical protein
MRAGVRNSSNSSHAVIFTKYDDKDGVFLVTGPIRSNPVGAQD